MHMLLEQQGRLQAEANDVVAGLALDELLRRLGHPVRVGSSAMGLMVRRDIDITVICDALDNPTTEAFMTIAAELMRRTNTVLAVTFRNDAGSWNREPDRYPDGLYLCVTTGTSDRLWTIDIWAIDDPSRQPDLAHLQTLLPRLTDTQRLTILTIKQELLDRPGDRPPSALVYEAVVDHSVTDIDGFDKWLSDRQ